MKDADPRAPHPNPHTVVTFMHGGYQPALLKEPAATFRDTYLLPPTRSTLLTCDGHKRHCQAKKKRCPRFAVDSIVRSAERNPQLFWRHMPGSRSAPQTLSSGGDPSECTRLSGGSFNKHAADAPALSAPGRPKCMMNRAWF
jgi:hypothetical protein